jgi:hypothetical protein
VVVSSDPLVREALDHRLADVENVDVVDTLAPDADLRAPLRAAAADVVVRPCPGSSGGSADAP